MARFNFSNDHSEKLSILLGSFEVKTAARGRHMLLVSDALNVEPFQLEPVNVADSVFFQVGLRKAGSKELYIEAVAHRFLFEGMSEIDPADPRDLPGEFDAGKVLNLEDLDAINALFHRLYPDVPETTRLGDNIVMNAFADVVDDPEWLAYSNSRESGAGH